MDLELLRLRRHHHVLLLTPFSDDGGLCRDFHNGLPESPGRDDQASTDSISAITPSALLFSPEPGSDELTSSLVS